MESIKSNWDSVWSTCNLTEFRKRINTCFKNLSLKSFQKQSVGEENQFFYKSKILNKNIFTFNESFRSYNSRLRNIFKFNKKFQPTEKNFENIQHFELTSSVSTSTLKNNEVSISTNRVHSLENTKLTMTIMDNEFMDIRDEFPDLDNEIRSILIARACNGATIAQIRDDYLKITGIRFPVFDNVTEFLLTIPRISVYVNEVGTRIFSVLPSNQTKHMHSLVANQKNLNIYQHSISSELRNRSCLKVWRKVNSDVSNSNSSNDELRKEYEEEYNYISSGEERISDPVPESVRQSEIPKANSDIIWIKNNSAKTTSDAHEVHTQNDTFQDNLTHLYNRFNINNLNSKGVEKPQKDSKNLNEANLNQMNQRRQKQSAYQNWCRRLSSNSFSSKKTASDKEDLENIARLLDFPLLGDDFLLYLANMETFCKPQKINSILQSGHCISGQTIKAATKRIQNLPYIESNLIVNIGSVDILKGNPLIQIEHDFRQLMNTMVKRNIRPILTTLAPLANYSHDTAMKIKLERFNEFIKREGRYLGVIDIWSCMVNDRNHIVYECFQQHPRNVTGLLKPLLLWNKIGRQRILKAIEDKLEY